MYVYVECLRYEPSCHHRDSGLTRRPICVCACVFANERQRFRWPMCMYVYVMVCYYTYVLHVCVKHMYAFVCVCMYKRMYVFILPLNAATSVLYAR